MTFPALILGIVISTLYGFVFHLFLGGGIGRLLLNVILAWIGFWIGQFVASQLDISLIDLGPLHLGIATIFSWVFIGIGHWLSQVDLDTRQKKT